MELDGREYRIMMRRKKTHLDIGGQMSKCGRTLSGIWDKFSETGLLVSCRRCLSIINREQIHGVIVRGDE